MIKSDLRPTEKQKVIFLASLEITLKSFVAPIAHEMSSRGWETIGIASGASKNGNFDRSYDLAPFRRKGLITALRTFLKIRTIMAVERPSVVELHTPYAVVIGRLAAFSLGIPSISVIHGTFLEPRTLKGTFFAVVESIFANLSARTIVLNEDDARFYRKICNFEKVVMAPAGGSGVRLPARDLNYEASGPTALYIGRLTPDKNLDFIVESWRLARNAVPELRLRIVGGSVEGEKAWTPPKEDGIDLVTWTDEPWNEIVRSTIVVSGSQREGFPMSVAEAVCLGVPVVSVSNRGSREISKQVHGSVQLCHLSTSQFAEAMIGAIFSGRSPRRSDVEAKWSMSTVKRFHANFIQEFSRLA